MMSKVNPKQQFMKDCLFEALMILMQKKDYQEITVTELAKVAGVSRMAYYRNYESILEIITDYMETHLFNFLFSFDEDIQPAQYDIRERILTTFTYFLNNKVLINNLLNACLEHLLFDVLDKYFRGKYRPIMNELGFVSDYELSTLSGICFKISIDWARNGMKDDVEYMADHSVEILSCFRKKRNRESFKAADHPTHRAYRSVHGGL